MPSRVLQGDCVEVMAGLEACSVDAIVTDPPYGLGFMGKKWDDLPPGVEFAEQALRVLKPGGYLLAFGGSRTYHRLACAVEDAGFEIRDQIMWLYGSGFPKSLDVSKAIDKAAGAEREVVGQKRHARKGVAVAEERTAVGAGAFGEERIGDVTIPATPEAERWNGWGTALKPAHEPIVLARKPLLGTVSENVLRFGTGALNIDGCRIGYEEGEVDFDQKQRQQNSDGAIGGAFGAASLVGTEIDKFKSSGRWPANVVLDEEAGRFLDKQSGTVGGGFGKRGADGNVGESQGMFGTRATGETVGFGDTGGASRFFYCAKASKGERNAGLDRFEERRAGSISGGGGGLNSTGDHAFARNSHPTVKPIELMRYLCRLVTPPAGTILDPFLGSGTTGCAAALEGFGFVGIEREPEYVKIAEARIAYWAAQPVQLGLGEAA